MDLSSLLRFGYETLGLDKPEAVSVYFFLIVFKILKARVERYREDRKGRVSEFIAEIEKNNQPKYHIAVEQTFQNRFGYLIDYPIIKFLTKQKTPSADVIDYITGRHYLEFNHDYSKISYKGKYTPTKLKLVKWAYLAMYMVSASFGFFLMLEIPDKAFSGQKQLTVDLLTILGLLLIAYFSVDESLKPQCAIDMMSRRSQTKPNNKS